MCMTSLKIQKYLPNPSGIPYFTDSSLLADVSYVLCLDALGNGEELHLHVSKPPKEGSQGDALVKVMV